VSAAIDNADALRRALGADRVRTDVPLAPFTTFRIGGPADLSMSLKPPTSWRAPSSPPASSASPTSSSASEPTS